MAVDDGEEGEEGEEGTDSSKLRDKLSSFLDVIGGQIGCFVHEGKYCRCHVVVVLPS